MIDYESKIAQILEFSKRYERETVEVTIKPCVSRDFKVYVILMIRRKDKNYSIGSFRVEMELTEEFFYQLNDLYLKVIFNEVEKKEAQLISELAVCNN